MRKILFTLALLAFMVIGCCPQANAQEPYNPDFKASFFPTGWSLGIAGDVVKTTDFANWNNGDGISIGAQIRATKRIGTIWNLRYIADVPGLITKKNAETGKQFDRYGKALAGISLNFLPNGYLFTDAGLTWNPSTAVRKVGVVGQVGIGMNIDFGFDDYNFNRFFVEVGIDRFNNATGVSPLPADFKGWKSNVFATVGYTHTLGLREEDRTKLSILKNQPETIERLTKENNELTEINSQHNKAMSECTEALNRSVALNERLDRELNECRNQENTNTVNCDQYNVYFETSSYKLNDIEREKVYILAKQMKANGGTYTIDGYCSTTGTDEYNIALSQKRAEAVYDLLCRLGAGTYVTSVTGHGKTNVYEGGESTLNQMVTVTKQ